MILNQWIFAFEYIQHQFTAEFSITRLWTYVNQQANHSSSLQNIFVPASYLYFETDNDPEIRHLLLQIYQEHHFAILSFFQTHYRKTTLEKVAEQYRYSPKQVGRIMKECIGEAFGDVIRGMKMKKAAELLPDRKYPPEQVTPPVGFATVNSFYRSFRDYYGKPPMEWIEQERHE